MNFLENANFLHAFIFSADFLGEHAVNPHEYDHPDAEICSYSSCSHDGDILYRWSDKCMNILEYLFKESFIACLEVPSSCLCRDLSESRLVDICEDFVAGWIIEILPHTAFHVGEDRSRWASYADSINHDTIFCCFVCSDIRTDSSIGSTISYEDDNLLSRPTFCESGYTRDKRISDIGPWSIFLRLVDRRGRRGADQCTKSWVILRRRWHDESPTSEDDIPDIWEAIFFYIFLDHIFCFFDTTGNDIIRLHGIRNIESENDIFVRFFFLDPFHRDLWIDPECHKDEEYCDTKHPENLDFPCRRSIFSHESIWDAIPDALPPKKPPYYQKGESDDYDKEGSERHGNMDCRRENGRQEVEIQDRSSIGNSRKNQEWIWYFSWFFIYSWVCKILFFHLHSVVVEPVVSHISVSSDV